jgi:tetratricopeptide (TPR) repeat protein
MFRWLPVCLLALASGCATFHQPAERNGAALSPDDARLAAALGHYARGLLYESEGGPQSPQALREFEQAAELDPGRYRVHARVAAVALMNRDAARAAATLEELCRQNPTSVVARTDLGTVYNWMGQVDKAVAIYRDALQMDPSQPLTYQDLARILFSHDRDREALEVIGAGLVRSSQPIVLIAFLNAQGAEFLREGSTDRATACFEHLASHSPARQREFLNLLAEVYEAQGRIEDAAAAYERALAIDPPLPASFVKLASLRLEASPEKAVDILNRGLSRLPNDQALLFSLAYVNVRQGRLVEALEILRRLREGSEGEGGPALAPAVYLFYASTCDLAGAKDLAERIMLDCIRLYPETPEALNYVAYSWAERGERLDEARDYANRALSGEPDNGAYVDTLGWICYRQKDYAEALKHIRRAVELLGDDPTVLDHLGDVLAAQGDGPGAVEQWQRSLGLNAADERVRQKLIDHGVAPETLPAATPPAAPAAQPEPAASGKVTP